VDVPDRGPVSAVQEGQLEHAQDQSYVLINNLVYVVLLLCERLKLTNVHHNQEC